MDKLTKINYRIAWALFEYSNNNLNKFLISEIRITSLTTTTTTTTTITIVTTAKLKVFHTVYVRVVWKLKVSSKTEHNHLSVYLVIR